MKLIIDIPEDALKEMKTEEFISIESLNTAIECIKNGTPLDDVKDKILDYNIRKHVSGSESFLTGFCYGMDKSVEILDNIGKSESEAQETETWNGIHAQITAPKGTFDAIWEDAESEEP